MAKDYTPTPLIRNFWKVLKAVTFPLGFLILLGRIGVKLLIYMINSHFSSKVA